jgi:FAD:protein FMN transferase
MMPLSKLNLKPFSWRFSALGTAWEIETATPLSKVVQRNVAERLEVFDRTYSRFRSDSLVHQLQSPGYYVFPEDVRPLMRMYRACYELTHGQMTPLIGSMLEDAGYDADYSMVARPLRPVPPLDDVVSWDEDRTLHVKRSIVLDVGAAGKGYAVDIIAAILEENGYENYLIDASGDIRQRRGHRDVIGLEDPFDATKIIGTMAVQNKSLCASASNRRAWGDYHHIMNPYSRLPEARVIATWVVADDTLTADAIATALFFIDDTRPLLKRFNVSYVRLLRDGRLDVDPQFKGELFT